VREVSHSDQANANVEEDEEDEEDKEEEWEGWLLECGGEAQNVHSLLGQVAEEFREAKVVAHREAQLAERRSDRCRLTCVLSRKGQGTHLSSEEECAFSGE
jgi:hypothetical protein